MKTHLLFPLPLLSLLLGGLAPADAAAPLPAVHGRVYGQDEKGANLGPLPGAKIELLSGRGGTVIATVTANSPGGYYQIKDLPPADYAYRITSAGFKTEDAKRGFTVPQNSLEYVHDFLLTKQPAKRERCDVPVLIVKRQRAGDRRPGDTARQPVPGARMILRPASPKTATPPNQPFVSSDRGELTLRGLAPGDYDVSIDAPECQPFIGQLQATCQNNDQIIFELQPCDEALHSIVRTLLRDGWGPSPQAKAAAARATQSVPGSPNKEDDGADYARALTQVSAGSYDTALATLAGVSPRSPLGERAASTRLWLLLTLHQPAQVMNEARALAQNHSATRDATPTARDTAQVCGLAIGLMRGPWEPDVGKSEAIAFERDLLDAFQGELRAECDQSRSQVAADYAKLKAAMDAARRKITADAGTREKDELARIDARQAMIAREVKAIDADLQRGPGPGPGPGSAPGMTPDDEQTRIQLTGFAQQRQALAGQIRSLQARLQQLAAMASQQSRPMPPQTTQPVFPQGDPRKVPGRTPMPPQPRPQPAQVNPQIQSEMIQVQAQLRSLQQQDAQLATSMANLQNRVTRTPGIPSVPATTDADLAAKRQRREALVRESEALDQQRATPFDPATQTTPEINALARRSRLVKTYRTFPLEPLRQSLLDLFTCGASKDPPRAPTPGAAARPIEIFEKDFPPARQGR